MKTRWLVLIAFALFLNGCMDLKMKMTIEKDWAGTAELRVEMLDQYYQLIQMQVQQSGENADLFNEDALRSQVEADGGQLVRYVNKSEEGIRTIDVEMRFPNARDFMTQASQGQMTLEEQDGGWVWTLFGGEMNDAFLNMSQTEIEQQMTMMQPLMGGLEWDFTFVVPQLIETNLEKTGSNTAGYRLTYDEDIAGKSGQEAVEAFRGLMAPKWLKFKVK